MSSVQEYGTRVGTIDDAIAELPHDTRSAEYFSALRDLYQAGWSQGEIGAAVGVTRWRVGQMVREAIATPAFLQDPVRPTSRSQKSRPQSTTRVDALTDDEARQLLHHYQVNATVRTGPRSEPRYHGDVFAEEVWKILRHRRAGLNEIAAQLGVKELTLRLLMSRRGYFKLPPTGSRYLKPHHRDGDVKAVAESARRSVGEWILWPVHQEGPCEDTAEDRRARFGTNPVDFGDDVQLYVDLHNVTYVRYLPGCGRRMVASMDDTDPVNSDNIAA